MERKSKKKGITCGSNCENDKQFLHLKKLRGVNCVCVLSSGKAICLPGTPVVCLTN